MMLLFINVNSIPWLLPILDVEEVAKEIVAGVRKNIELIILPRALGRLHMTRGYV